MAPDKLETFFRDEQVKAEETLLELAPSSPNFLSYEKLRAQVMARHVTTAPNVNQIAVRLYKQNRLLFPNWEKGKRVPQSNYRTQRA